MDKKGISTGAWIFLTALLLSAVGITLFVAQSNRNLEAQQTRSSALAECLDDSVRQYNSDLKLNAELTDSSKVDGNVYTGDAETMDKIREEKTLRDSQCHGTYGSRD
jgi:cell division protein FtsX